MGRAQERPDAVIIDSHVHAGHGEALQHPWDTLADIEVSLRRMDKLGIDKAVVLPINSSDYRRANRETSEIVAGHPDRLVGYAKVDQARDAGRVDEILTEAFGRLGLVGLKLHGYPTREVMDAVLKHDVPMLVDPLNEPAPLQYAAEQYPGVHMVIAHFGSFPSHNHHAHQQAIWLAKTFPNVYLDTSSVTHFEWLEAGVKELGPEKIIFGSDGPVLHCGVELAKIGFLKLSKKARDRILCRNIAQLLGKKLA